ncbi:MAG: DUF362 domain-containing protein [Eubacteriales bacterium]|nr:DUF362 domain-containing protein [Eubacteriales bacterium]
MEKSKVIILPCTAYEEENIYRQIKKGLELLGGLSSLIGKEEKILLKPNLLKQAEVERAVITHPVVVGAFARLLREEGYERIVLSDSCGHGTVERIIRGTGMDDYLRDYDIPAIEFSQGEVCPYPQGTQAKEFVLPKELLEADCVISLSKMKTHALERLTGAVKNSYGFVYGRNKAMGHVKYPSADSFARMLVDLNRMVGPRLYLMDGIVAMEGNGPGSGDPVAMNVMLLSRDPVALDGVFARLVHVDPYLIPTNYHGEKMGLGTCREEEICLLLPDGGEISMEEAVKTYGNPGFQVDRQVHRRNIWSRMASALKLFQKKPYILADRCIRCGICVKSCPVPEKAVDFRKGRDQPPVYDYKRCIRCFCCQEMCPQKAIKVK